MATTPVRDAAASRGDQVGLPRARRPRGHVGAVVVGSLAFGLLAGLLLAAAPFVAAEERDLTGAVLCGFALGWLVLAVATSRVTDQPQRWAYVPAMFMGLGGIGLIMSGPRVHDVLDWVWPPLLLVMVVWMTVQARRHLRSRSRRWCLYPVLGVLAVASLAGGYETVQVASDPELAMPGELVDVGGHSLHLHCTGSGSPTVVLEPGGGEMGSNMGWIAPAVAQQTRVCVYDRAGRGWSEPAGAPQDAARIAADLRTLLQRGGVSGPVVLAGHSFGGLYVETYAAQYPDDVAGVVLIDPTPAASPPVATPEQTGADDLLGRVSALVSATARFGVTRLYAQLDYGELPTRSRDEVRASIRTAGTFRSTLDEYLVASDSMARAAQLTDLGDTPLVVLTAGIGSDAEFTQHHEELARLSTESVHRVVDGASHGSMVSDEEDAAGTTQAILEVVAAVRGQAGLAD